MSKLLIPHGLTRSQLDAFRSVEVELNKLSNGGALTTGTGSPTLTSNLQDGSLYYDYTNINLYVFSGSTTSNAVAVVANGVTSQWQSSAGIAEAAADSAQTTADSAQTTANTAQIAANTAQTTANTANTAANTANTTANSANIAALAADVKAINLANNIYYGSGTTINGANVQTGTLSASLITTGSLSANLITTGVLNADLITAGTINANLITAGTINANLITAGVINADLITAGSFSADRITTGTLSADRVVGGTLVGGTITATAGNGQTSISGSGIVTNSIGAGSGALAAGKAFWVSGNIVSADLFSANSITTSGSLTGTSSGAVGVYGQATGASTGHGVRGRNTSNGRSGLVGPANAFDFYAENAGTYGPFTGSHDALTLLGHVGMEGDILVDTLCVCRGNLSNTIFEATTSTSSNQKAVIGIHAGVQGLLSEQYEPASFVISRDEYEVATFRPEWDAAKSIYNLISVNSVGEGQMNIIGEGGDLVAGDLIVTSSTPGKGMKQSDDIVRSYTVAKVREAVTFNSLTEEKLVACIYLCG